MDWRDIEHGWDVFGSDGEKVGDVSDVREGYIVVSKGWLFPSERYVPTDAIGRVEHDRVYLSVSKDEIDARGWDRAPAAGGLVDDRPERTAEPAARGEGGGRVQLREEELRPRKETAQAGEVRVRKDVVEEEQRLDVPVTREEAVVERRPVEPRPADRPIGEGGTVRVPLHGEQVEVEKRPVVTEEVEVGKRQVQDTERVSGTVRREEPRVEREGDADVREDEPRRRG
jgi:uncharacterized protein (TIGR02271 family)